MSIAVLTYHAMNIDGNAYADNDHVALARDLEEITAAGFAIRPLPQVVDALLAGTLANDARVVALSCDDGSDFDYRDIEHPAHGPQRGLVGVLRDFRARHGDAQPQLHLTCFVIVSPAARAELDRSCMVGRGWWNDDWWAEALASGLAGIASHSWDHNHGSLERAPFADAAAGTFRSIVRADMADREILHAQRYLERVAPNPAARLFAYPYGESNDFLVHEYLPALARREATAPLAAFTTDPGYVHAGSDRWRLPRFVCGSHWRSPAQLRAILEASGG
jgi:hypothetical protein